MEQITANDVRRFIKDAGDDVKYLGLTTNPITYNAMRTVILIKGEAKPVIVRYNSPSRLENKPSVYWSRKIDMLPQHKNYSAHIVTDLLEWFGEGKTEDTKQYLK
jgi:hypothetical protein